MSEEWRDVVGWEGLYQVSSEGDVRSLIGRGRPRRPRIDDGYLIVGLSAGERKQTSRVHRLVAAAFIPNPGGKPHINHIDSNRSNNRVSNLEWVTQLENNRHANRMGRRLHLAKLSPQNVVDVRRRWQAGATVRGLAREFGVHLRTMRRVLRGYSWRNFPVPQSQP